MAFGSFLRVESPFPPVSLSLRLIFILSCSICIIFKFKYPKIGLFLLPNPSTVPFLLLSPPSLSLPPLPLASLPSRCLHSDRPIRFRSPKAKRIAPQQICSSSDSRENNVRVDAIVTKSHGNTVVPVFRRVRSVFQFSRTITAIRFPSRFIFRPMLRPSYASRNASTAKRRVESSLD